MSNLRTPKRRKQNSSCDDCRRARVGCDASDLAGQSPVGTVPCSRCKERKRTCTFTWLSSSQSRACNTHNRVAESPQATTDSVPEISTVEHGISQHEFPWPNPSIIGFQLQKLYWDTFDRLFASWIAAACNNGASTLEDFYNSPDFDHRGLTNFEICVKLDNEIQSVERDPSDGPSGSRRQRIQTSSEKEEIEARKIATTTINCFCARWLPVIYPELRKAPLNAWHEYMMRHLWRKCRKLMLKAINKRSYKSVFYLILFGLTPVPIGVGEEEESEGISGSLCFQVALHHIYSLRCRRRTLKFSTDKVITKDPTVPSHSSDLGTDLPYFPSIFYENMVYSAGIIIDTTSSVTLDYRSSLVGGSFGMDKELYFEAIRTRAPIVHERWEKELLFQRSSIGDDEADEINMFASQWKLYLWKAVANLKEALRDGCSEEHIYSTFEAVNSVIEQFHLTFCPMLQACMDRLDFLGCRQRFNSWLIFCHWYLAVLLLIEAIEASGRTDLLAQLKFARGEAVQGAINGFKLGSTTRYLFSDVISLTGQKTKVQCPLLAIDPYPVHVIASSQLVLRMITKEYEEEKMSSEVFETLLEIISGALEHLPRTSHSVEAARKHVRSVQLSLGNQPTALQNTNTDEDSRDPHTEPAYSIDVTPGTFSNSRDDRMEEYITLLSTFGQ